ncbi:piRNA biogenesis protein EXD1 [Gracilariopsis chorda]|uniref:PiRNA biogenesis protein EXD1 n=1 Tax=Gracilariopsis chorda TaxID=448386 RepID=A0A2V3IWT0_9FLOR|nr:piRNA biogenesis protein EXD1 [Gracilariopsis chorda]|eukprot:PXF46559.1 piRNA biogenesis protein EXD1 [Gracilariopsis chorda]
MSTSRYEIPKSSYTALPHRRAGTSAKKPKRNSDVFASTPRTLRPSGRRQSRQKPRYPDQTRRHPPPLTYVTTLEECARAVSSLSEFNRIAVDCEGVALSRTGRLCLLQLASPNHLYLIDLVRDEPDHARAMFEQGGLKHLLQNPKVYKVIHDCRHDSDALYHQFGVKLAAVIDTQVVFAVLRKARGMPEGLPVSLKTLLKKFTSATEDELGMKNAIKTSMQGDDDFWLRRPLSQEALQYARLDVEHLLSITSTLSRYIRTADPNAWKIVLKRSQFHVTVFRDDEHGPRKAQQQYEHMARIARRQRLAFTAEKRIEKLRATDPLRSFTFDRSLVVQLMHA